MEFLRRALNPWGEDVPIGVSWDLIWAAVIIGAVFVVGHALMVPKKVGTGEVDPEEARGLPEKLQRHTVGARGFHWSMSATMFVLLITAFFPVIGIQFPWVTIHWIAGSAPHPDASSTTSTTSSPSRTSGRCGSGAATSKRVRRG